MSGRPVADSPPLLPFVQVASAGDQQVEAEVEEAPAVQVGGRQQLLAALNDACVKGGLPSG